MYISKKTTVWVIGVLSLTTMLNGAAPSKSAPGSQQAKPLKIFIMAGQSNAQGYAAEGTLKGIGTDPATKDLYAKLVDENGKPRVLNDVHVAAFTNNGKPMELREKSGPLTFGFGSDLSGDRMGPEYAFGATMHEHLKQPILIIKTAWGGKTLNKDFCPPSAQEAGLRPKDDDTIGHFYRLMVTHVNTVLADLGKYSPAYDPKQGYEIAGFVWFQGWNDYCDTRTYPDKTSPDQFALYGEFLSHFIRDVRKDFKAPTMPFVIGVMGIGSESFQNAMAIPSLKDEFKGNVLAVRTAPLMDKKLLELTDRGWKSMNPKYDNEKKYTELFEKLAPLLKEADEVKKMEDRNVRKAKQKEIEKKMEAIKFTPEEIEYLINNKSNAGYHYLGSAKNYSRFGEAFANAMYPAMKNK